MPSRKEGDNLCDSTRFYKDKINETTKSHDDGCDWLINRVIIIWIISTLCTLKFIVDLINSIHSIVIRKSPAFYQLQSSWYVLYRMAVNMLAVSVWSSKLNCVRTHTHTRIRFHQMRVKKVTEFYNLSMRFTASTVEFFSHLFFFHSIRNKYTWMHLDNKKIELYNCVYILVAVDQRTTVFPSNDQMHQQQANGNVNMAHIYVYISTFYFVRSFFFLSLCF